MLVQRVLMPGSGRESWTLLEDDGGVVEPGRALPGLPGGDRALAEHGAGLRRQPEAVVRVPRPARGELGRGGRRGRGPVRGLAACPGGQRDRAGGRERGPAARPTVNRYLAGVFGFYDHHARTGVGVAAELVAWRRIEPRLVQAVPASRDQGPADPGAAGEAARAAAARPRTLEPGQIVAILAACEHLRDRFLLSLLAETGMRVGQALGLRHCRLRLPRAGGAHRAPGRQRQRGAGQDCARPRWCRSRRRWCACTRSTCTSSTASIDSDYVFVNLFGGRVGAADDLPGGAPADRPHRRPHRDQLHRPHAAAQPRHRHGPPGRADRGGRAAAHPPVLDDHEPGLCPSGRGRHPPGAAQGRGLAGRGAR